MDIKVMDEPSSPACPEGEYVRVQVCPDPEEDTLTLATIERVICRSSVKPTGPAQRVKKLIEKQRMTLDAALGFATLYAARKKIGLVLTKAESSE